MTKQLRSLLQKINSEDIEDKEARRTKLLGPFGRLGSFPLRLFRVQSGLSPSPAPGGNHQQHKNKEDVFRPELEGIEYITRANIKTIVDIVIISDKKKHTQENRHCRAEPQAMHQNRLPPPDPGN